MKHWPNLMLGNNDIFGVFDKYCDIKQKFELKKGVCVKDSRIIVHLLLRGMHKLTLITKISK